MASLEPEREAIRQALGEVVGTEVASRMMEHLPPFPWHELARQGDLVALREDMTELRGDVDHLRTDMDHLRGDVDHLRTDVDTLKGDVDHLRTDVDTLKGDVRVIRETLDLRFDSLRDGLSAQFHADLLAHSRMMFFSMLGAVFTSASLAFAAVRL